MLADPPAPTGWPKLQSWLVDRIKRAAIAQLHASRAGEVLLLRIYLIGEEATEAALQEELMSSAALAGHAPDWIARQLARHLAEEQTHARSFADALAARGAIQNARARADWLSRRKIAQWQRLATHSAHQFTHGLLVPAYAIGLCAEQMAARVLRRHCAVLEHIEPSHPFVAMLRRVLADEERHIRQCAHVLERLVRPEEADRLAALLARIRHIERAFGVTGAVAMLAAGLALRARPRRMFAPA